MTRNTRTPILLILALALLIPATVFAQSEAADETPAETSSADETDANDTGDAIADENETETNETESVESAESDSTETANSAIETDETPTEKPDYDAPVVFESEFANERKSESPRNWTVHASFGIYELSQLDDDLSGGNTPTKDIFGDKKRFYFNLGMEYLVWKGIGTIGLEAATGYFKAEGKSIFLDGTKSPDSTAFNFVPLKGSVVYRFSYPWDVHNIPLVPFVKLGLDYYIWWITNHSDDVARWTSQNGGTKKALGGIFGFHVSYGLQICLDWIDPKLAKEFDSDVGVNNTYIFVEGIYSQVNNFWSGDRFNLSDHHMLAGLLIEF